MNVELVVIADQHAAVNTFSGFVHTADFNRAWQLYFLVGLNPTIVAKKIKQSCWGNPRGGGLEAKGRDKRKLAVFTQ